ncbi:unnamed protein product [Lactuca saligna]|uniref:ATP-dependent DNA helicase n=1 Tax=Lactuca saligna TaxID=75948 RepID=A0AA35ZVA9_LACSI|nr:unnamed protein product [Lactuca saligna]
MRLTVGMDQSDIRKVRDFANWLFKIGEGKLGGPNDGEMIIDIPDDILINDSHDPIDRLPIFLLIASSIVQETSITTLSALLRCLLTLIWCCFQ